MGHEQERAEGRGDRRTEEEGQRGGSGGSTEAQVHVALGPLRGWRTVVLAGLVWAVCQEEAPLYPSLPLGKVWQRSLLCLGLALCGLSLRALLCHRLWPQGAPSLDTEEVMRQKAAGLQACESGGRSTDGPVPLAHALMDGLLLCLLSETLEEPRPPHIQALAHRLEKVTEALQRADVLEESLHRPAVQSQTGVEDPGLPNRLMGICAYLQQRARSLHALAKAQGDYGYSVQDVQAVVEQHWTLLVELHVRVTVRKEGEREQREREEREREERKREQREREEREKEEDIETVLRDLQRLSTEWGQVRGRLQLCRTHLSEITGLLQELDGSQQALGDHGVTSAGSLWTKRLLQADSEKCEEVNQHFLSLERLTSCLQVHLGGLRPDVLVKRAPPIPPTPPSTPPVLPQLHPSTPPVLPQLHPSAPLVLSQLRPSALSSAAPWRRIRQQLNLRHIFISRKDLNSI